MASADSVDTAGTLAGGSSEPSRPAAAPFPDVNSDQPRPIWNAYFKANRPDHRAVARLVERLLKQEKHDQVAAAIQAALTHGQSQPWMYEALAVAMEAQGRPAEEIERVVMSIADFGGTDFGTMMFSARYLANLNRNAAGLRACRSAAMLMPERPEPYVLGLALARKQKDVASIEWAACGVLQHVWTRNYQQFHRLSENVVLDARQTLMKEGREEEAAQLEAAMQTARHRDVMATLVWNGTADLDLIVEEPNGSLCSFENPDSPGGGVLTNDGFGPDPKNCREEYICASGQTGDYRFRVRHAAGVVAGNRATLTIVRHVGTPQEEVTTRVLTIGAEEPVLRVTLEAGRRQFPRQVSTARFELPQEPRNVLVTRKIAPSVIQQAVAELEGDRGNNGIGRIQPVGGVGFNPVIQIIPDGVTVTAAPVISADRRYVRLGISPVFTNVTGVFTFTFLGGANTGNTLQPGAAQGP